MLVDNHSTEPGQLKPLEEKMEPQKGRGSNHQVLSAHISAPALDHKCCSDSSDSAKDRKSKLGDWSYGPIV